LKEIQYKIKGVTPILFHNVYTMDLIKPKKMTHSEFEQSDEVFKSRVYFEDNKLVLPPRVILGLLKNASAKSGIKQDGKRATYSSIIRAIIFVLDSMFLDQNFDDLERHREYVTVQRSKILRIFPMLKQWSGILNLTYDETQISEEALTEILIYGGSFVGMGDYRPLYGRFSVEKIKRKK